MEAIGGFVASKLASLGIIEAAKAGESVLRGVLPTEWDRNTHPGLIFHIPPDKVPFLKMVVVKEYERALFLRDGKLYAVLPPGRWFLGRMPIIGVMELIWVDIGIKRMNYGLRTLTKDGVEIGANGVVFLRVTDPERFIVNLVTGRSIYTPEDLEDFLGNQVNSIMRAEMANYDVQSLYVEREMFVSVARVKMDEMLGDLGLEFRSLEVPGILLPEQVKTALQAPLIAAREAQATVLTGTATAEVLSKIRGAGVDPIKYKAAEALMKYSERPGAPAAPFSGDFLMPLVFFGMLMKDGLIPTDVKDQLKEMFPRFAGKTEEKPTERIPEPKEATEYSTERIQSILDGLDERLAKGELSEEIYKELRRKWKNRLGEST